MHFQCPSHSRLQVLSTACAPEKYPVPGPSPIRYGATARVCCGSWEINACGQSAAANGEPAPCREAPLLIDQRTRTSIP